MNQGRILPLLGPAFVLYLLAEVFSAGHLDGLGVALFALCFALSLIPATRLRDTAKEGALEEAQAGGGAVCWLALAAALSLIRWTAPGARSMVLDLTAAVATPWVGALVLRLSFKAPDEPSSFHRWRIFRRAADVGAAAAAAVGVLTFLPPLSLTGYALLPARLRWVGPAATAGALAASVGVRALRRRLRSSPTSLAQSAWALIGSVLALSLVGAASALVGTHSAPPGSAAFRLLVAASLVSLLGGHLMMLDPRYAVSAGRFTRHLFAGLITLCLASALLAGAYARLRIGPVAFQPPESPIEAATFTAALLVGAALSYQGLCRWVDATLTPSGGRLLKACEAILAAPRTHTTLLSLGGDVLPPLRRAAGQPEAAPILYALDPPARVRLDAASMPHVESRGPSPCLIAPPGSTADIPGISRADMGFAPGDMGFAPGDMGFAPGDMGFAPGDTGFAPGDIIVRAPLEEQVVRQPPLRPLVDALTQEDALCAVPLLSDGTLEGLLLVPKGKRRVALTLEEIDALTRLGAHLGGAIALLSAQARAQLRTRDALVQRIRAEETLEATQETLERVRRTAQRLKEGGHAAKVNPAPVAYSAAMRALTQKLVQIAPHRAPVLLVSPPGASALATGHASDEMVRLGRLLHHASGRGETPFVIADASYAPSDQAEEALFGSETTPGWLEQAGEGTLLLLHLPALPWPVQKKLASSLATRRARSTAATGYPTPARVVGTVLSNEVLSNEVLSNEVLSYEGRREGAPSWPARLAPELRRRFEPLTFAVPGLNERPEDLWSLVWAAVARACRARGKDPIGVHPDARRVLSAHRWSADVAELELLIDRAVARAAGDLILAADLGIAEVGRAARRRQPAEALGAGESQTTRPEKKPPDTRRRRRAPKKTGKHPKPRAVGAAKRGQSATDR